MRIDLENDHHGTYTTINVKADEYGEYPLTKGQVKKIKKELCGIDGCTCGAVIDQDFFFHELEDKTGVLVKK